MFIAMSSGSLLRGIPVALLGAALIGFGCGGASSSGAEDPRPTSVEPPAGSTGAPTSVTIRGDNFLALTVKPAAGEVHIDAHHRAWIAGVELQDLVWIDPHTLRATVPRGLPLGPQPLVVENAFGRKGRLEAAFVVTAGALTAELSAGQPTVSVGQAGTLQLKVTNSGVAPLEGVVPSAAPTITAAGGAAAVTEPPSPPSIPVLGPNESATFTWPYTASAAGQLSFLAFATGRDAASDVPVSAAGAASVAVQLPAALTAELHLDPATEVVGVGDLIVLYLTVTNSGGAGAAAARDVAPAAEWPELSAPGNARATRWREPDPPSVASLAPGAAATFRWAYIAESAGVLSMSASAAGGDANSGAAVIFGPMDAEVTIEQLVVGLALPPSVGAGAEFTATMAVTNPGDTPIFDVRPSDLQLSDGSLAMRRSGPSPQGADIEPNGTAVFRWTYVHQGRGALQVSGNATGNGIGDSSVTAPSAYSNAAALE